jgi:hypothetical protein
MEPNCNNLELWNDTVISWKQEEKQENLSRVGSLQEFLDAAYCQTDFPLSYVCIKINSGNKQSTFHLRFENRFV